jgi:ribosomal protein L37AE/L43A
MNDCPCCTGNLLRHVRSSGVYWFCPNCRQEMPNLATATVSQLILHGQLRTAQITR